MIEDKKHNIIVAPDSGNQAPEAHQVKADGKNTKELALEAMRKESNELQREALTRHYQDLRDKNVKCAIVVKDGMKPAIIGTHKREPFAVFLKVYHDKDDWAAILITRYKGVDTEMEVPYEVLSR